MERGEGIKQTVIKFLKRLSVSIFINKKAAQNEQLFVYI